MAVPVRAFRDAWTDIPEFRPWLSRVQGNPFKAFCKACKRQINAELTTIKRHKITQLHRANEGKVLEQREQEVQQDIQQEVQQNVQQEAQEEVTMEVQQEEPAPIGVALATILFACFTAKYNLPYTTADHLLDLMKVMFPDSSIAQRLTMKRTKCTEVVKSLGKSMIEDIVRKLRRNLFSVIIDENTHVDTKKTCIVNVRYLNSDTNGISAGMLELLNLNGGSADSGGTTGHYLYSLLMDTLAFYQIPTANCIGFAADATSIVMGEHGSLCGVLRDAFPGITIFKHIRHSIHLCTVEAAKTLPRDCENLLRNIYNFFSHSSKRKHELEEFQAFCESTAHTVLYTSQTRWLSLHQAVEMVLEQWDPLILYFTDKESEVSSTAVQHILDSLRNPSVKMYYNFLDFILPVLNKANQLFQRQSPTIHLLHENITELYKNLLGYFCHPEILKTTDLMSIDPCQEANHLPLKQVYLGSGMHALLRTDDVCKYPEKMRDIVQHNCRQFIMTLCVQLKKRFDLHKELWRMCSFLAPKKVLEFKARLAMPTLYDLVQAVPRIYKGNIQHLDDEWRNLDSATIPEDLINSKCGVTEFYTKLMKVQDSEGSLKFLLFPKFALQILSLPTSNADAERIIFKLNLMKTDKQLPVPTSY